MPKTEKNGKKTAKVTCILNEFVGNEFSQSDFCRSAVQQAKVLCFGHQTQSERKMPKKKYATFCITGISFRSRPGRMGPPVGHRLAASWPPLANLLNNEMINK